MSTKPKILEFQPKPVTEGKFSYKIYFGNPKESAKEYKAHPHIIYSDTNNLEIVFQKFCDAIGMSNTFQYEQLVRGIQELDFTNPKLPDVTYYKRLFTQWVMCKPFSIKGGDYSTPAVVTELLQSCEHKSDLQFSDFSTAIIYCISKNKLYKIQSKHKDIMPPISEGYYNSIVNYYQPILIGQPFSVNFFYSIAEIKDYNILLIF